MLFCLFVVAVVTSKYPRGRDPLLLLNVVPKMLMLLFLFLTAENLAKLHQQAVLRPNFEPLRNIHFQQTLYQFKDIRPYFHSLFSVFSKTIYTKSYSPSKIAKSGFSAFYSSYHMTRFSFVAVCC